MASNGEYKLPHLQTPAVRAKRAKAIRATFLRKRREARLAQKLNGADEARVPAKDLLAVLKSEHKADKADKAAKRTYNTKRNRNDDAMRTIGRLIVVVAEEMAGRERE